MSILFTNVPIGVAVQVVQAKLREDYSLAERTPPDRVADLLDICLISTHFRYGGEFYELREGAGMGLLSRLCSGCQLIHGIF